MKYETVSFLWSRLQRRFWLTHRARFVPNVWAPHPKHQVPSLPLFDGQGLVQLGAQMKYPMALSVLVIKLVLQLTVVVCAIEELTSLEVCQNENLYSSPVSCPTQSTVVLNKPESGERATFRVTSALSKCSPRSTSSPILYLTTKALWLRMAKKTTVNVQRLYK